jgi:hypothetical protein
MVLFKVPFNVQLGWLDNVSGIPQAHFSLPLIGHQGLGHQHLLPIG